MSRRLGAFIGFDDAGPSDHAAAPAVDMLRTRLGRAIVERRRIDREISKDPRGELAAKATRAIELGRDDLARAALAGKIALDRRRQEIDAKITSLDSEIAALERAIGVAAPANQSAIATRLDELDALIADAQRREE